MHFRGVHMLLRVTCSHQCHRFASIDYKHFRFSLKKQTRMLGKLMAENAAERKQWSKGLPSGKMTPKTLSPKRYEVLSRILLATITSGLTTSVRAMELADHGLLINRVQLSSCGQSVHVLWSSGSLESDPIVDKLLKDSVDELRSAIVHQCISGFVPQIIFERDAGISVARDVEAILNLPRVRRDLETKGSSEQSENAPEEEEVARFDCVITTNILGLKRDDMLRRIKPLIKIDNVDLKPTEREVTEIPERLANIDHKSQKQALLAFMSKQAKAEKKLLIQRLDSNQGRAPMTDDYDEFEPGEDFDEDDYEDDYDDKHDYYDSHYGSADYEK